MAVILHTQSRQKAIDYFSNLLSSKIDNFKLGWNNASHEEQLFLSEIQWTPDTPLLTMVDHHESDSFLVLIPECITDNNVMIIKKTVTPVPEISCFEYTLFYTDGLYELIEYSATLYVKDYRGDESIALNLTDLLVKLETSM